MSQDPTTRPEPPPTELLETLARHGQDHLLRHWDELDDSGRARLIADLRQIDFGRLDALIRNLVHGDETSALDLSRVAPVTVERLPHTDAQRAARRQAAEIGDAALANGEVAVVVVAGGQGTRLGFEGPKGTYPIGPVSAASLFQIHAEKILALSRRHETTIPLYVMTSLANHDDTVAYFAEQGNYGLEQVRFFHQGQMPAVDRESGKVLLAAPDAVALSPDGHGGTLAALAAPAPDGGPSCIDEMHERGIRTIYYFQVDNPMVRVAEPAYIGLHRQAQAELSFKVVEKVDPAERVGVVVVVEGRPQVIEYSDLPAELAEAREPDGRLRYAAGSIAIHLMELDFVRRLVSGAGQLPFHRAIKKVPHVDERGQPVSPSEPNAVKFEQFIFDALPLAERYCVVETDRAVEFEPLKNAIGTESPATVRQRMSDLFAGWLESAGATIPRRPDGSVPFGIEISPLFALDAAELRRKVQPGMVVDGPLYLK